MVSIKQSLHGAAIFLTGVTGYFGRALLYRLLSDLGPKRIYVLVRSSGKRSAQERWEADILSDPNWQKLLPNGLTEALKKKLILIEGDVACPKLGMSPQQLDQLARKLDFIINSAASISFEPPLDEVLSLNINGPLHLLRLAQPAGCPFLQVSTAFVCGNQDGIIAESIENKSTAWIQERIGSIAQIIEEAEERFPDPTRPNQRLEWTKTAAGTLARQEGWPNTYTFSKFLAEQRLVSERGDVPLILFRPTIISSAWRSPYPGWIDGIKGMDALVIAFGQGQLSQFPANKDLPLDLIPVDLAANACLTSLVAGMQLDVSVFQYGTSHAHPLTFYRLAELTLQHYLAHPNSDSAGNDIQVKPLNIPDYDYSIRRIRRLNRLRERIHRGLKHLSAIKPLGRFRRRLAANIRLDLRNMTYMKLYSNFTTTHREFSTGATDAARASLPEDEQHAFYSSYHSIDWDTYIRDIHVPGLRRIKEHTAQ